MKEKLLKDSSGAAAVAVVVDCWCCPSTLLLLSAMHRWQLAGWPEQLPQLQWRLSPMLEDRGLEAGDRRRSHEVGAGGGKQKKGTVRSGSFYLIQNCLGRWSFSSSRSSNSHRWGCSTYQVGGQSGWQAWPSYAGNGSCPSDGNGVRAVVGCRWVSLLNGQAGVVARSVKSGWLARISGISAVKVFLVDAVSKCVRNATENCSPDLTGGHFSQLDDGRFRVESGVWRHYQVRRVFEGRGRGHQVVGLALVDVQRGGADSVVLQGRGQSGLVD